MAKIPDSKDFMSKFIAENNVPTESIQHFHSRPWTAKWLTSPSYKPIPAFSRVLKKSGEDYFFSRTVATKETIPHFVTLQRKDFRLPLESPKGTQIWSDDFTKPTPVPEEPDTIFLLSLGPSGLDGHPQIIHGGVSCAILDETMGLCVMLHHQQFEGARDSLFTVNLNVTYRAPVPTPNDIIVKSWLVAWQARKWYAIGQITDKDGNVLTEAKGIWVLAKREAKI